jgi:hypothetical protein
LDALALQVDKNDDGQIDYEEFVSMWVEREQEPASVRTSGGITALAAALALPCCIVCQALSHCWYVSIAWRIHVL